MGRKKPDRVGQDRVGLNRKDERDGSNSGLHGADPAKELDFYFAHIFLCETRIFLWIIPRWVFVLL